MDRNPSAHSTSSRGSSSSSIREIEGIEKTVQEEKEEEEKIYVAVKKELKEGKSTLLWLLQNMKKDKGKRIVITHVHIPAQTIPMMGSKFHASRVEEQVVKIYREAERDRMFKSLDNYITICSGLKVTAEKLVIESDNAAKGLIELISLHGIAKLVMGAAADKHFSRRMKVPKSKTAITVNREAHPSCKIFFVCKGIHICTREAFLDSSGETPSPASCLSSLSSQSEQMRSRCSSQSQAESSSIDPEAVHDLSGHRSMSDNFRSHSGGTMASRCSSQSQAESSSIDPEAVHDPSGHRSKSDNFHSHSGGTMASSPLSLSVRMQFPRSRFISNTWDGISGSFQSTDHSFCSVTGELLSNSSSLSMTNCERSEEGSAMLRLVQESNEDLHFPSPPNELEDGLDAEIYDRLQDAHIEAEKSKHEAYNECLKRQKAERHAIDALRKAKIYENLYAKELAKRKDIEESLAREKLEAEILMNQRDEIFEQVQMANKQKQELELHIADSDRTIRDLEEKLLGARQLLNTHQMEYEELKLHLDATLKEVEELRQNKEQNSASCSGSTNFSEFSFSEIEIATCNFSDSLKIGEGGFGSVYKGFLRNTTVAIKMLNPESMQGQSEFRQQVDVLSRVRHPNLVTFIGACSDARALVFEFLPNGSLEDRLECKSNTPPLTWQDRTRIAAEICSALIFLHSNKPHAVVHGDLKPENILLDANLISKLGDFGICCHLPHSTPSPTTIYNHTHPSATFVYAEPEFLATGELTPHSDIYSFGVVILRLLTGKSAFEIVKEVEEALDKGYLHEMIDPTAGDWPFVQAKQLAHLGLSCCGIGRKNRPDLVGEVWRVLEPMMKANSSSVSSASFMDDSIPIPSYFICPIFQEIMRDPCIAADGFTYEAEALKGWIEGGHKTSPMTNLMLPNCDLIPNRALRSAIQEWLHQHPHL